MPLYTYECPGCKYRATDMRVIAERHDGSKCYACGKHKMELQIDAVRGIVRNPAVARSKRR